MEGVFLHVLADALGSVGVIISSLLIHFFGWTVMDPICSILISGLILVTVLPLLKETGLILMQYVPQNVENDLKSCIFRCMELEHVTGYRNAHFWEMSSGNVIGSIHIRIGYDANPQNTLEAVNRIFLGTHSVSQMTVQVEGPDFSSKIGDSLYREMAPVSEPKKHSHCHGHSH